MQIPVTWLNFTVPVILVLSLGAVAATPEPSIDRFTANALNIGSDSGRPPATLVEIDIDRWSTDAERDRLTEVVSTGRQDKLFKALTDLPRVGMIRTPDLAGDPLYYARRTIALDKSERIIFITGRPIRSFESWLKPGISTFPFSVIDLRLGANGRGTGTLTLAAKLAGESERDLVAVADRGVEPVTLTSVKRVDVKGRALSAPTTR